MSRVKPALDALSTDLGIVVVGNGYIDMITIPIDVVVMLDRLTELGIATILLTLCCNRTPANQPLYGCPHGSGGPGHVDGFYSS